MMPAVFGFIKIPYPVIKKATYIAGCNPDTNTYVPKFPYEPENRNISREETDWQTVGDVIFQQLNV